MEKKEIEQKILNEEEEETLDENQNSDFIDSDISEDMGEEYDPDEELPSYLKEEAEEIEDREELKNKYKELLSSKTMSELLKDKDSPIIINIHSSGNYIIAAGKTNTVNGSIIGSENKMSDSYPKIIFSNLPNKCPPALSFKGEAYSGYRLVNICKPYTALIKNAELIYTNPRSPYLKLTFKVNIFDGKTITITDTIGLNDNSITFKRRDVKTSMLTRWRELLEPVGLKFRKNQYKALEIFLTEVREHGDTATASDKFLKKKASLTCYPEEEFKRLKQEKDEAKKWINDKFLSYFKKSHIQLRFYYSTCKSAFKWRKNEDGAYIKDKTNQITFLKLKIYRYSRPNTRQDLSTAIASIKESIRQLERAKNTNIDLRFPDRSRNPKVMPVDIDAAIMELTLNLGEESLIHG